ncbi:phosphatase PAP2 family protein [Neolewinella antarctica]|uniref:Membrane-associated phospholipid phosphatase n=1 Tax=Neolewinella antarctica TaxID=442734 RepID=A0ABX0XAD1_9BACT|nr:phosphatase PAP2 family protein [Neolewinella antarctica]NJC26216.1 membrane-associated phospholipid phosphatase [Neolewinella antarctica]
MRTSIFTERTGVGSAARLLTGVALIGLAHWLDRRSITPVRIGDLRNPGAGSNNPFDWLAYKDVDLRAARLADVGLYGGPALPLLAALHPRQRPNRSHIFLLWAEAMILNFGATSVIKNSANRPRPYVFNDNFPEDTQLSRNDRAAFLSGHASHATLGVVLFARLVGEGTEAKILEVAAWVLTGFMAGYTGYLRVKAAKHWPTDAIAGCLLGYFIASRIYNIHEPVLSRSRQILGVSDSDAAIRIIDGESGKVALQAG